MSTLIDRIESRSTNGRTGTDSTTPAERLRTTMAACRVQFTWFGTKKSLTAEQKAQAAEPFDAEGQFLVRRQEAARHEAQRVPGRHRDPDQDHRLLARPDAAVPRTRRPADQARPGRGVRPADGRLQGRAGRCRQDPRPHASMS